MKRSRHSPEQILRLLAEGEKLLGQGQNIEEVSRQREITQSTWHRWRNRYGGMKADHAKRLKELEKENTRLKKHEAQEDRRRPGPRHRHVEGAEPGNFYPGSPPEGPCRPHRAVDHAHFEFTRPAY